MKIPFHFAFKETHKYTPISAADNLMVVPGAHLTVPVDHTEVRASAFNVTTGNLLLVFLAKDMSEAPPGGNDNQMVASELVLGTAEGLLGLNLELVTGANGHEDLAEANTGSSTSGLTEGTTHTSLQPIGTGT
jgi:hypothetical protein